jgi:hypothetical protein
MKRFFLLICTFTAAGLNVSTLRAADPFAAASPTPSPASINIYDWYDLGEYIGAVSAFNFNVSVAGQMDETYKKIYDLMVKAHLSDSTIAAFKEYYPQLKKLPWDKDWETWTKAEQEVWTKSPAGTAWFKGLSDDAGHSMPATFFYWLGRHAIKVAWAVPYYQGQGWKKDVTNVLTNASSDYYDFSTNSNYGEAFKALAPDVQKAISLIAAVHARLKPKIDDPFNSGGGGDPLSDDEIAKLIEAAKQIRAAAQGQKLIKA